MLVLEPHDHLGVSLLECNGHFECSFVLGSVICHALLHAIDTLLVFDCPLLLQKFSPYQSAFLSLLFFVEVIRV